MAIIHPTKEALINVVLDLLKTESLVEVHSEEVLHKSGISKGSMYHHFEDFQDLLEQAQVRRYGAFVDRSIVSIAHLLVIKDKEERSIDVHDVPHVPHRGVLPTCSLQSQSPLSTSTCLLKSKELGTSKNHNY